MRAMADKSIDDGFLAKSPLFEGLSEAEIKQLMEIVQVREFSSGSTIVEQGTDGDAVYLLYEGSVTVNASQKWGGELKLATLAERGAFFGEVSVVDPGPRSATVRAEIDAVLLEIKVDRLEDFFAKARAAETVVLRNVARVLAQRLRDSNILLGTR